MPSACLGDTEPDRRWHLRLCEILPHLQKLELFGVVKKTKNIKSYLDEYENLPEPQPFAVDYCGYEKCLSALSALHKLHVSELTQQSSKLDRQPENKAENDQE
jgi:hypothetical protein